MRFIQLIKKHYFLFILILLSSCGVRVKNYAPNKAFVFQSKVIVNGPISKETKKNLSTTLNSYFDDSLMARYVKEIKFSFKQPLFTTILKNPPAFDSANIFRSEKYMNAYLNSRGYYYATFPNYTINFDTVFVKTAEGFLKKRIKEKQIRTTVTIAINTGKNAIVDSVGYVMLDSNLQKIALASVSKSDFKKDANYSKQGISSELDRLASIYRDSGYYKLTREDFLAEVDTINPALLKLTFNIAEQTKLLKEAATDRTQNPRWKILFKQKPFSDSSKVSKYYINKTYFYPETKPSDIPDSIIIHHNNLNEKYSKGFSKDLVIRDSTNKFRLRPLRDNAFLRKDSLYRETLFYKSLNNLSRISAWQQVDARIKEIGKDSLDLHIFLVPALKQSFETNLEGSRNTGDITAGNTLGLAVNFTYKNKNIWRQAIQSATNLRLGTELNIGGANNVNSDVLQTLQASLLHSYIFPRLIMPPFLNKQFKQLDNKRTVVSGAAAYTDRRDIYRLRSATASFGYEATSKNGTWGFSFKPLNIELYGVDTLHGFDSLINQNPFLKNSFRDGTVIGIIAGISKTFPGKHNKNVSHFIRLGFEESGLIISAFTKASDKLFTYEKIETEYKYLHKYKKTSLAGRVFAGAVFPRSGQYVPVYKEFYMGGPNSMRAWGLRQLGLGSSILSDTSQSQYTDRFGDFSLEANLEYRFPLFTTSSFQIASALFADAGNVWALKPNTSNPNGEINLARFGRDLAVGVGTGLRFDFNYFLIRVDFAYKVKDPARQYNDGWMKSFSWSEKRINGVEVKNYAVQLGINLPF
ncbi:MAG: BamA/TamA family outer membrane protein [Bacteroidetes bacterium]|nr:BamA/TamA family outer membrane protein [Bacteroidota bacterium]